MRLTFPKSEKNLREIFDSPPDIYDKYRIGEKDGGEAVARAALHVVVMDEFDAVARARGGRGGKGDQGDAGVARDSVVNQLLAKMDGVHPLPVPTLVIGLTNKRSLIEPGTTILESIASFNSFGCSDSHFFPFQLCFDPVDLKCK